MVEIYDTYAYFWIQGFECDPAEISEGIGLEPNRVVLKGEQLKGGRVSIKHS